MVYNGDVMHDNGSNVWQYILQGYYITFHVFWCGFDSILTITDHDCTKVAIFLPCNQTIDTPGIVELYTKNVFPHYGAPRKIISDRDPRFMVNFTQELCHLLGIKQNLSTTYHPQTDGQSECTNQWLEQYLWIYGNYQQDDWANWLPMVQFVHNSWPTTTMGKMPFELLMGHTPQLPDKPVSTSVPSLGERKLTLERVREQAQYTIRACYGPTQVYISFLIFTYILNGLVIT